MKVVIDVPDETYKVILANADFYKEHHWGVAEAIVNGTPLPKGHGDLIDRDTLDLVYEVSMTDDWKTVHEIANYVKYAQQ